MKKAHIQLLAEKKRPLARIKEIDKLLKDIE